MESTALKMPTVSFTRSLGLVGLLLTTNLQAQSPGPTDLKLNGPVESASPPAGLNTSENATHEARYTAVFGGAAFALIVLAWAYALNLQVRKRRKAEQALGDQLKLSKALINAPPIALYVRDHEGRLVDCNLAYLTFLHTTREAIIGKPLVDCHALSPANRHTLQQLFLDARHSELASHSNLELEINGHSRRIYQWSLPFQNSAGVFAGVSGGWQDISEQEQLRAQLHLAKTETNDANESKSTFLASMSHEMRTPISVLTGLIEMLRVRSTNAEQMEENLRVAHQSAQNLLSLIGDILDLSKIEAGAMTPVPRPTHLAEVLQSAQHLFTITAKNKNLEFGLSIDVVNPHVIIDALMLNQIVANLISNAIKFTDQGFVSVSLKQLPDTTPSGHSRYAIDVIDSGRGMNECQRKAVFEPFVQVRSKACERSSTGLGLSICTRLTALLGAQLRVESVPGEGSRFTLLFSAEPAQPGVLPNPTAVPCASNQSLNILVVEDHAPYRLLLCRQLEYLGHRPLACEDGETALDEWMHADPPFDLTITDCNMPRLDGYELTRKMRATEHSRAVRAHPIFGLTANTNAQAETIAACLDAGMTQCLFKPLGIEDLTLHIGEIAVQVERRVKAAQTSGGELQKLRVLRPDAYDSLVDEMIRTNRDDGARLQQLLLQNDYQKMTSLAHKIKGGAQLADAQALVAACAHLESLAQREDDTLCHEQVDVLLGAMRSLEEVLLQDR